MCYKVKPFDDIFDEGIKTAVINFQKSKIKKNKINKNYYYEKL